MQINLPAVLRWRAKCGVTRAYIKYYSSLDFAAYFYTSTLSKQAWYESFVDEKWSFNIFPPSLKLLLPFQPESHLHSELSLAFFLLQWRTIAKADSQQLSLLKISPTHAKRKYFETQKIEVKKIIEGENLKKVPYGRIGYDVTIRILFSARAVQNRMDGAVWSPPPSCRPSPPSPSSPAGQHKQAAHSCLG